jgi:hypothetical protein
MKEAENFYEWMKKLGNIYLSDNEEMTKAYQKFFEDSENKELVNLN